MSGVVKKKEMSAGSACAVLLLTPFIVPALALYGAFAYGYVLAHIWAWYAVPLGAIALGWKTFAAGSLAFWLLRPSPMPVDADAKSQVGRAIGLMIAPWLTLLWAWWLL